MSWQVTGKQKFPAVIGEPFGGGYFAGYISHTADGNPTHALIVAPASTVVSIAWKTSDTTTSGATSVFDGVANTNAIAASDISLHPAAGYCANLEVDGYTDWYLPAVDELIIAYSYLKPGTFGEGFVSTPYAVPPLSGYFVRQTALNMFKSSGAQAFLVGDFWSSSAPISFAATAWNFNTGSSAGRNKVSSRNLRAFRRIAL
jgi:hypothetical protein